MECVMENGKRRKMNLLFIGGRKQKSGVCNKGFMLNCYRIHNCRGNWTAEHLDLQHTSELYVTAQESLVSLCGAQDFHTYWHWCHSIRGALLCCFLMSGGHGTRPVLTVELPSAKPSSFSTGKVAVACRRAIASREGGQPLPRGAEAIGGLLQ